MWARFLITDSIITTTTITVTTTYITANKISPFYLTTLQYLNAFSSSSLLTWFPWKASNINWEDIFIPFRLVRRLSLTKSNILTQECLCPLHYITDKSIQFSAEVISKLKNIESILKIYCLWFKEAQRKGYILESAKSIHPWKSQNPDPSAVRKNV